MKKIGPKFTTLGLLVCTLTLLVFASEKSNDEKLPTAIFAGGCFWCMEGPFEKLAGVKAVVSGYCGGQEKFPSYEEVSSSRTGHTESVEVTYDPTLVSYRKLLETFWRSIDPTDSKGQFADRGQQYRPAIFYKNSDEKKSAELSKAFLHKSKIFKKPVEVEITAAGIFYPAEEHHQDYYKKNPEHYKTYRIGSGRENYLRKKWKGRESFKIIYPESEKGFVKPSSEELKKKLTALQYRVTQEEGTEPPFKNSYWNNKKKGLYVDIVSGEALFSSKDKYKSGTGWPSFSQALVAKNIVSREDHRIGSFRTEVRSKQANSHLGHVFNDGPKPTGLRYCINSASLKFIPLSELKKMSDPSLLNLYESRP